MKLYHTPTSPYVRKVMVTLIETGQRDDVTLVPAGGTPLAPAEGYSAKNPLTKVPALEREDGPTLYDSRVICRFFDHRAGAGLYPEPPRLWETMTLEASADGMIDAGVVMVYEDRLRPEQHQYAPIVEAHWAKVRQVLDTVESRWMAHLAGPLDAGQIAMGCALGFLDLRLGDRGWRDGAPNLAAWYESFSARDSMVQTAPPS
ncbi:glutathione S-transferase [Poseidonocella sedimentorum]|uniref:Glutathione S-transferase n=1 Tax=Poseidonocella sedimentorum TaxID=871652 RepID=A0A1I6CMY2_9RHOB|nr:glutathione S-transferase [Poseidonocella sedimentorum]SFQ94529.1 Glutathione S-transferase [Poseidonocella sedimentorum]